MTTKETVERVRSFIRLKHFSRSTEESYCYYVRLFCEHSRKIPRSTPTEKRIESFLSTFAENDSSASTQNIAFNAVLFLYRNILGVEPKGIDALRARRPKHVRNAPQAEDTRRILTFIAEKCPTEIALAIHLLYGTGSRVSEPLQLRFRDVQLKIGQLTFRQAKQHKDRVVGIPRSLFQPLSQQLEFSKQLWERDGKRHPVWLPGRLRLKYPQAGFSLEWFWIFPARGFCVDERNNKEIVRSHLHEANIRRALKQACWALGISKITPHELRHGFATDCLNNGVNPRALQQVLGHQSLETTMLYCHAEPLSVRSPLDVAAAPKPLLVDISSHMLGPISKEPTK